VDSVAIIVQPCYLKTEEPCKSITPHHLGSLQNILSNVFLAGLGLSGLAAVISVTTEGLNGTAVLLYPPGAYVTPNISSTYYTPVVLVLI